MKSPIVSMSLMQNLNNPIFAFKYFSSEQTLRELQNLKIKKRNRLMIYWLI